jgi:hypothetical protein
MSAKNNLKFGLFGSVAALGAVLFVPPVRDWVFSHKIWPLPLPWDLQPEQLQHMAQTIEPGDVIIERNLHSAHWMLFCKAATGSTWVHASIVDYDKKLINMFKVVRKEDLGTYLEKASTNIVVVRPPYAGDVERARALAFARSQLGVEFDPSFKTRAGNCVGLIGASLEAGGVHVNPRPAFGFLRPVDTASNILRTEGMKVVWCK